MKTPPLSEVPIPIEASADGKRNAFHVQCSVVGHNRPYAMCLHLCDERKDGRLEIMYAECSAAIGRKTCPALAMRREEREKGRAIYFIERVRTLGEAIVSKMSDVLAGFGGAAKPATPKSTPSRKSSVIDSIDTTGYADVITAAVSKPAPAPSVPAIEIKAQAGESPLQMARRLMGMK